MNIVKRNTYNNNKLQQLLGVNRIGISPPLLNAVVVGTVYVSVKFYTIMAGIYMVFTFPSCVLSSVSLFCSFRILVTETALFLFERSFFLNTTA